MKFLASLTTFIVIVFLGCGRAAPKTTAVTGVVTSGGQPLEQVAVLFTPVAEVGQNLASSGLTDDSGRFELIFSMPSRKSNVPITGKGVVAGTHRVTVTDYKMMAENLPRPGRVPEKYTELKTSPLKLKSRTRHKKFILSWNAFRQIERVEARQRSVQHASSSPQSNPTFVSLNSEKNLMTMKTFGSLFLAIVVASSAFGIQAANETFAIGNAHITTFPAPFEFYASGNDDRFAEYGVAGFNFTSADFGGSVASINSLTLSLTHDTRSFSDGTAVRFYYSSDDFADGYANLFFDDSGANDPDGIVPADFTSLVDLGVYPYETKAPGEVTDYELDLSAINSSLVDEINGGSNFQVIIASPDLNSDIAFSGIDNVRAPGAPTLIIDAVVPEPSSLFLFFLAGASFMIARRR